MLKLYEGNLRLMWHGVDQLYVDWIMEALPFPAYTQILDVLGYPNEIYYD